MNYGGKIYTIISGVAFLVAAFLFLSPTLSEARSGCCSHHGGVCGCGCCDGTSLSSTCAPYYPECNSRPSSIYESQTTRTPAITYSEITDKEIIAFSKQTKEDSSLDKGQSRISQIGINGEKTINYKVTYTDGTETKREKTSEQISKPPIDEITLVGTKEKPAEQAVENKPSDQPKKTWLSKLWDWVINIFN